MSVGTLATRRVVFDFNDGSGKQTILDCLAHQPICNMPVADMKGFVFVGWFTKRDSGRGFRFTEYDRVEHNMVLYAHYNDKTHRKWSDVLYNHNQDTWSNEDKNQNSLALGSDGYDDYIDDLRENDPGKPDDEMHAKLEEHNEKLAERLQEKAMSESSNETVKRKIRWQMAKRAETSRLQAQAFKKAMSTETTADDERLKGLEKSDDLIYDDGVSPDSYDDVYHDIVF